MNNTCRVTVLSALLAMCATEARADTSVSPMPILIAKEGQVMLMSKDGSRILADCLETYDRRMLAGPEKGTYVRRSKPCDFRALVTHQPTGRWAVAAHVDGDSEMPDARLVSFVLAGRTLDVPKNKAGRAKGGNFIVMGDVNGVLAITPGVPEIWNDQERLFAQYPEMFTADGSRVLVSIANSTLVEWWSWSFGPRPESVRVLPRGMIDAASNMLVSGELRTVLRHPRGGVRVATMEPTGKQPWKVGPPMKQQVRHGMLTPVVLGDTMLFYREGDTTTECEGTDSGSYRRVELSTGRERIWRRHEKNCSTHDSFDVASPLRRTLYFVEGVLGYGPVHLYEYDLDRDTTRELVIDKEINRAHDISEDGRTLVVDTYQGIVLYDVIANTWTVVNGMGKINNVKLLGQP